QHASDLLPASGSRRLFIGFSAPVFSDTDTRHTIGVLFGLVDWRHIQEQLSTPALVEYFRGLVGPDVYPSAYGWVWKSDANTILAHPILDLYGKRITQDLG